jgi:hypothetical protein
MYQYSHSGWFWSLGVPFFICLACQGALSLAQEPPPPHPVVDGADSPFPCGTELLPIDLPTALQLANGNNPSILLARLRVDEAYARVRQAQVAWLPNLDAVPSYYRHDGEIQNAAGLVFGTSKSNVAVVGGPVFDVDTSVGLFAPLIARQLGGGGPTGSIVEDWSGHQSGPDRIPTPHAGAREPQGASARGVGAVGPPLAAEAHGRSRTGRAERGSDHVGARSGLH